MKYIKWLMLTILIALSAGMAGPASARSGSTVCTDVISNTTIRGDLIVPKGVYCELNGVTVMGDVRIHERSTFAPYDSTIKGGITGNSIELLHLLNTTVGERIRVSSPVSVWIERGKLRGDIRVSDGLDVRVLDSQVSGSVTLQRTNGATYLCGTTITRDVRIARNEGWIFVGGGVEGCAANQIRGTLRVHHNRQEIHIANNIIWRNLLCAVNEPALFVSGNQVGGKVRGQCGANEPVDMSELGTAEE